MQRFPQVLLFAMLSIGLATAQSPEQNKTPTSFGPAAVQSVMAQYAVDMSVHMGRDGTTLPENGRWLARTTPTAECAESPVPCVLILYNVPAVNISCHWTVQFPDNGSKGVVTAENDEAARYFLKKLTPQEAKPLVKARVNPEYPSMAEVSQVSGDVVLTAIISERGDVKTLLMQGGPTMLRQAAINAATQWKFQPLKIGAMPVRWQTELRFHFKTSGAPDGTITAEP